MSLRIMIVDDHPVMRSVMSDYIGRVADFELTAEAESGEQALNILDETNPDIVLVDISMPEMDGIELVGRILDSWPDTKTLMFTGQTELSVVERCFRAGARGYLLKGGSVNEFEEAVRLVHSGKTFLSKQLK